MTLAQRALFRVLLVAFVTLLALILTAPSDEPPLVTIATAPGSEPVIYEGEAP